MAYWYVYLLQCSDGSFYCGVTTDFKRRLAQHNAGKASKYTRSRRPVQLKLISKPMSKQPAHSLEWRIKQLPKQQKVAYLMAQSCETTECENCCEHYTCPNHIE